MATILRQSTQIKVRIGVAVAVGDGFTPITSLTLSGADEAELLKANGAATVSISGATWAAVTSADGWYDLTLTAALTDTVGEVVVAINDDSLILPIFARFQVIEEAAYDALYAASASPATAAAVAAIPTTMVGTDDAALATALVTAQDDLDTLTGSDGATLATAQGLYAPSKAGDAMALTSGERTSTADALLNRDMSTGTDSGSPTVRTVRQALRALRNRWLLASGTLSIFKEDDTTTSWTSTVTGDAAADPIKESNPA